MPVAAFSTTSNTFSSSMRKLKNKPKVLSKTGVSGDYSHNIYFFLVMRKRHGGQDDWEVTAP
ncbi:hypothetical protein Nmel_007698 [Mimus melanotis]